MAHVQLSGLINAISGRVGDYVFYKRNGKTFVKPYTAPSNPQSDRQQLVRGIMNDLADSWQVLSKAQKNHWQNYANLTHRLMSGFNAFIGQNCKILSADHPELKCISWPPRTVATPTHPAGFCVSPAGSNWFHISWNQPNSVCLFVIGGYRPTYGTCNLWSTDYRFIETVRGDVGLMCWTHTWASGSEILFKIRTIDPWGRYSPWSHPLKLKVP
jgi:hypothetical protein